jgi:hypothetical protein
MEKITEAHIFGLPLFVSNDGGVEIVRDFNDYMKGADK